MRLKDYGRKSSLRKEFVNNPKLLIVGVDIGRSCYSVCFGSNSTVLSKKFEFNNSRDGFKKFGKNRGLDLKYYIKGNKNKYLIFKMLSFSFSSGYADDK